MQKEIDMAVFAKRLKEARTERGLTQKELAALSGVSTVMISSYERTDAETGKNPALSSVFAIANALDVSIDWLCGLTEKPDVMNESSKIDTDLFLRSLIAMLDRTQIDNTQTYMNGINRQMYAAEIFQFSYAYNFIEEYLEVQPVLKGEYLPEPIKDTVISKVISKYKNMTIDDLFERDKILADVDDELPF